MPLMISIIQKHFISLSMRIDDSKERVVEIIRGNPLRNQHLIFRIKTPRLFVFMANNTDNKFKDNTINKKVLV
jgi:hypothetical protein